MMLLRLFSYFKQVGIPPRRESVVAMRNEIATQNVIITFSVITLMCVETNAKCNSARENNGFY